MNIEGLLNSNTIADKLNSKLNLNNVSFVGMLTLELDDVSSDTRLVFYKELEECGKVSFRKIDHPNTTWIVEVNASEKKYAILIVYKALRTILEDIEGVRSLSSCLSLTPSSIDLDDMSDEEKSSIFDPVAPIACEIYQDLKGKITFNMLFESNASINSF